MVTMLRTGILHSDLAARLAALGHTDLICLADRGLPVPPGVPVVDLAVVPGVVDFRTVLDAVLGQIVVQRHTIASQTSGGVVEAWFDERAPHLGERVLIDHEDFKRLSQHSRFVVRTGEETAYANILLECGVPF